MSYGKLTDHEGILQTPWLTLANGDEVCYLVSFESKQMRFVLFTGHGYDFEKEELKQQEIKKVLKEMQIWTN